MFSFITAPYLQPHPHHRHLRPSLATANYLRSHSSAAEFLGVAFPIKHLFGSTICCFSINLSPSKRYMNMEPEITNSAVSAAAAGGENGAEDYVYVAEVNASAAEEEEESVEESEKRDDDETSSATGGGELGRSEKRELPEELSRSVVKLTCESTAEGRICDVYLIGTAHVSSESCREVQALISFLKPEVVFLELCSSRVSALHPEKLWIPTVGDMVEMWKKGDNLFGIVYCWFLAKISSKLEVLPGAEFRVAYEEAMKYGGRVILGDRPVQITLKRTWMRMPLWHRIKFVASVFFQTVYLPSSKDLTDVIKSLDNVDMLTRVAQAMSNRFPTIMETLVTERDKFMSVSLLKVAKEHSSVVAVVGKGHLSGIKNHWKQDIEVKELLTIPTKKPIFSGRSRFIVTTAVAVVAAAASVYLSIKK